MSVGDAFLLLSIGLGVAATIRARPVLVAAHVAGALASLTMLVVAFVTEDWRNAYVVSTTRPGLSLPVRIAGLWGGAEGSLLLFAALISVAALVLSFLRGQSRPVTALASAYLTVTLVAANPFDLLDARAVGGLGLQPVLEHPAMTWHPPILYVGLVGMIVPGLLAIGGSPPTLVRRATGVALALLTAGLATGAAWAHAELGWGGYWAWDPIESAGLVAWLAGAATLHRFFDGSDWKQRSAFLLPALAAVWATTLTRAGLVQSVHAFADRPGLRAGLLATAVGWSAALAWLALAFDGSPARSPLATGPRSWTGRRIASIALLGATGIVALGTYEPAIEQALGTNTVGVAGVFFARALWPIVIGGAILAVRADWALVPAATGAVVALALTPLGAGPFGFGVALAGGAVAGSAIGSTFKPAGRRGWLAHAGVGIALIGIGGTMAATIDQLVLTQDQPVLLNGQTFLHRGIELQTTTATASAIASVEVDGEMLRPRIVNHRLRNVPTTEAATIRSLLDETQVLLSDGQDQTASYRINRTPRLNLVWLGLVVLALGLLRIPLTPKAVRPREPVRWDQAPSVNRKGR